MVIGIDGSRGNEAQRTGTEWYSFHLIRALTSIVPSTDSVILYVKQPLQTEWGPLPKNWKIKILNWKPGLLWTQLRLSWEMLWHAPDVLFVPAHTLPLIHPTSVLVAHDIGFERTTEMYGQTHIGRASIFGKILKWMVRLVTLGKYGTTEIDYHRWSMRFGLKQAKRVITISDFSRAEIEKTYPFAKGKTRVIWHALPFTTPLKRRPSPTPTLLFVGRIETKKNLLTVLEALTLFPSEHRPTLVCVGKNGVGHEAIRAYVKHKKLEPWVKFLGWLSESEVQEKRAEAWAMILPSVYEGFGLPILEAWQAKVPMIASDIPALKEVGGSAVRFFQVHSNQDCYTAMQDVLWNQITQEKLVNLGQQRLSLFSLEHTAQKTFEVIRECASV